MGHCCVQKIQNDTGSVHEKTAYLIRATKKFLEGTNCKSPIQAVEQGVKTLSDWIDALSAEQEIESEQNESRRAKNKPTRHYRSM
jgi:hypothetical protein